jgi:hypothetical protein
LRATCRTSNSRSFSFPDEIPSRCASAFCAYRAKERSRFVRPTFGASSTGHTKAIEEFYNFADLSIIDSLNKLRDANLEFTLAHQSIADLELVSKEFASQSGTTLEPKTSSTRTTQSFEKTVRMQQGALFTSLTTGDASSRLVEAYKLHPNAIKSLARCGQGYLFNDEGLRLVSYGMLPQLASDFPLARKKQATARGLRLYERFIRTRPR